jgi:serine/threonine-protein kinase
MSDRFGQLQAPLAGHYAIERELGRGGMATVYLARDLRHDRPVALKVLHPELAATLGPERFQREIRLAARLQHPHILTVHDSGEIPARGAGPALLWFTMPYVEGETLRDRLSRERQLPLEDAIQIAREAAEALEYAHQHGVIHRDIKPENILLTGSHPLVADFGIARALGGGGDRLTETGLAMGTPAYMSPEQATGSQDVDARTDVYALGCVLYEMLAGEPPFTGPTPQAILAKRFTGEVPSVRRVRPIVPESLDQAIARALAPVPADRFSSAAEFARALAPAATTAPVLTPLRTPVSAPPVRLLGRRPAFAMLMLGIAIGGGALFAWRRMRGGEENLGPKRIAVLPFENLGAPDQAYFADGITDEVRGKLTALQGLEVMARSSSNQYRKSAKSPRDIGQELGVQYLLTGTVRWEPGADGKGRVQVSPELIQVSTGAAKWQQPFDAALTDVFQVQADIAGRVAQALNVALADSVRREIAQRPTTNEDAYNYYLRGQSYAERATLNVEPQTMAIAQQMYEKAIGLDSGFALAWARLSGVHLYFYRRDATDRTRMDLARTAAGRAARLAPNLAESHIAVGEYAQTVDQNRDRAMAEYAAALKTEPNNAELRGTLAFSQFWRGQKDSAVANVRLAAELDPRSGERALDYADLMSYYGHYALADSLFDHTIALAPDQYHAYYDKANNLIDWKADVAGAKRVMHEAETRIGPVEFVKKMCIACFDWAGPMAADFERILDQLSLKDFSPVDSLNYFEARAERAHAHGDAQAEKRNWETARGLAERQARARPKVPRWHDELATIYAGLGQRADAVREHQLYQDAVRARGDTYYIRAEAASHWAALHLRLGDRDAAVDSLRASLTLGDDSWNTRMRLSVDPFWTPLRGNPKFEALLIAR